MVIRRTTITRQSYSTKRLRVTEEELEDKVTRIIETQNLTADKLQAVLSFLADDVGMHPLELEKYYRAKKETLEKKGQLEDVKKNS